MKKYAALGCLLLLPLVGCKAEVTTGRSVDRAELEKQVASLYTADDPKDTVEADCGGDLAAKVGAEQTCHMTVGDSDVDVTVRATSVDGSDVKFSSTPFLKAQTVADTIDEQLKQQNITTTSIACDDDLVGEVGKQTMCHAETAKDKGDLEATVTKVDGLMINFKWKAVS